MNLRYNYVKMKEVRKLKLHICLVEPEIPQNTGNIARTCAVTGASLHLIKPFGFEITDAKLKRAGLDYWDKLDITYYDCFEEFLEKHKEDSLFFFSQKGKNCYTDIEYKDNAYLVFGKESCGLPESFLRTRVDDTVRIPMRAGLRSLNLGNCVAIAAYEVLRRDGFELLKTAGILSEE
jgi:tRNA (cytidine/uridine-2'-O-)-methyltransferase